MGQRKSWRRYSFIVSPASTTGADAVTCSQLPVWPPLLSSAAAFCCCVAVAPLTLLSHDGAAICPPLPAAGCCLSVASVPSVINAGAGTLLAGLVPLPPASSVATRCRCVAAIPLNLADPCQRRCSSSSPCCRSLFVRCPHTLRDECQRSIALPTTDTDAPAAVGRCVLLLCCFCCP